MIKKVLKYAAVFAVASWGIKRMVSRLRQNVRYRRDIPFLNFALAVEKQQAVYYRAQYEHLKDDEKTLHLAVGLNRASKVEEEHVKKIIDAYHAIGLKPPRYTDIAYSTGKITGELLGRMAPQKVLAALVWIEQRAIDHYHKAAKGTQSPELRRLYMENLVDEEFHAAWAQEMIEQIANPKEQDET